MPANILRLFCALSVSHPLTWFARPAYILLVILIKLSTEDPATHLNSIRVPGRNHILHGSELDKLCGRGCDLSFKLSVSGGGASMKLLGVSAVGNNTSCGRAKKVSVDRPRLCVCLDSCRNTTGQLTARQPEGRSARMEGKVIHSPIA